MALIPGGRGNDLARVVGIPTEPEAAAALIAAGTTQTIDVGEVERPALPLHRQLRVRLRREPDRQRDQVAEGQPRLPLRRAASPRGLEARPVHAHARRRAARGDRATRSAAANSKAYGGGMFIAPEAVLDDGLLDVVWTEQVGKLRFLSQLPKVFKGEHTQNPEVRPGARGGGHDRGRPPVRGLRRRRPPDRPAGHRPPAAGGAAPDRPRAAAGVSASFRAKVGARARRRRGSAAARAAAAAPPCRAGCSCGWRPTRSRCSASA